MPFIKSAKSLSTLEAIYNLYIKPQTDAVYLSNIHLAKFIRLIHTKLSAVWKCECIATSSNHSLKLNLNVTMASDHCICSSDPAIKQTLKHISQHQHCDNIMYNNQA